MSLKYYECNQRAYAYNQVASDGQFKTKIQSAQMENHYYDVTCE